MNKTILTALFSLTLALLNPCDAQTPPAQSQTNAPSLPVSSGTTEPSGGVVEPPPSIQRRVQATDPAAPSSAITAPPGDITSLIVKEILSANNQVVSQVASMYQNLGLFITIIVTLVGGVATWMSYVARRSVQEFIQEWTEKVKSLESDMKEDLKRLRDAVAEAEGSAKKAAEHEQSIKDSQKIVDKILEDYDRLRAIPELSTQLRGEEERAVSPQPVTGTSLGRFPQEALAPEEEAEVTDRLKGKINPPEGVGQKP